MLVLVVVLIGALLPRTRTETKQCILNAPVDAVFAIVTNNQEWHYRSSLDDLEIICTQGDIEEWEETANSVTIRFKTLEKRPHSFYSFEMDSKMFTGKWQATFEPMEGGKNPIHCNRKDRIQEPVLSFGWVCFYGLKQVYDHISRRTYSSNKT